MFYTYILYSSSFDRFYIGQTNDLKNRIFRHNSGYVNSTKAYKPWEIEYAFDLLYAFQKGITRVENKNIFTSTT